MNQVLPSQTTVLVTGASRGLGREIARALARRHVGLVLDARGEPELELVTKELRGDTDVLALAGDVADPSHAERLVQLGLDHFGAITALVNNASTVGLTPLPRLDVYPPEALRTVFEVNVLAPLRLIQLVLPGMKSRGSGVVVNVTSDAGVEAYPGWGGYGASKAALEHVTRTLTAEMEDSGVRFYAVDPGDMNTQMHREADPDTDPSSLLDPADIAPSIVRLIESGGLPSGRYRAQALNDDVSPALAGSNRWA